MRRPKRFLAALFCAALVLMLLLSSSFNLHEAHHDCIGEDCLICRIIAMNTEFLRLMGSFLAVWGTALLLMQEKRFLPLSKKKIIIPSATLISWKIRLND